MGAEAVKEKQWTIFLGYESRDKLFVDWLYEELVNANLKVWYEPYQILVGDSIDDLVQEGLEKSNFLIVVISRWAVKSNWVQATLKPKLAQQIKGSKVTVLPLTLGRSKPGDLSLWLQDRKPVPFPRKGSKKAFNELLNSIKGHFERNGLDVSWITSEPPSLKNPFGLRGSVDPDRFVVPHGTDSLLKRITEDIAKKPAVVIIGASMMGKTSLLRFLASPQCREYYLNEDGSTMKLRFASLDFKHIGKSSDELLPQLARVMSERLPAKKHFDGDGYKAALDWIRYVTGKPHRKKPLWILLFDEFDRVLEVNGIEADLFNELYDLTQSCNLRYIIASHRKLTDLPLPLGVDTSSFFNSPNFFKEYTLKVWDESMVQKLMFKPYQKKLDMFDEEDVKFMIRLTGRHPLLLQIGCDHLFNAYRASGDKTIDCDKLLYNYMEDAERIYLHYWNKEISEMEREWLNTHFRKSAGAQEMLEEALSRQTNPTIRTKLTKLGLVSSEAGPIEIPLGLQASLEKILS